MNTVFIFILVYLLIYPFLSYIFEGYSRINDKEE